MDERAGPFCFFLFGCGEDPSFYLKSFLSPVLYSSSLSSSEGHIDDLCSAKCKFLTLKILFLIIFIINNIEVVLFI